MRLALRLAQRGYGKTSPNPMVGAILVHNNRIIGRGWHRKAGLPHAEIEALRDAQKRCPTLFRDGRLRPSGNATLYITLEPCSTQGRTPPCTKTILETGIKRVVIATDDPNPRHKGRGLRLLQKAGVAVTRGVLGQQATHLNEAFNHWIVHRTPFVTVKAAMTLDGKIATRTGESKWITGPAARAHGMYLRQGADAIIVGINTVLADDPSLTFRPTGQTSHARGKFLRRIILDNDARTPLDARVVTDELAAHTVVVMGPKGSRRREALLARRVRVLRAPAREGRIDLAWLLQRLGEEAVTSVLVEGGGEVNAAFLENGLAQRVAFFYAPKVIGGRDAVKAVAGQGALSLAQSLSLQDVVWRRFGPDLFLTTRVGSLS